MTDNKKKKKNLLPKYYNTNSVNLLRTLHNKKKASTCCKAISKLTPSQHKFVCQCFTDVIQQKKPFLLGKHESKELKKRLSPYSNHIKQFLAPRMTYAAKRNLLLTGRPEGRKTGTGIFTGIFFCLLPIVIDLISSKLRKK